MHRFDIVVHTSTLALFYNSPTPAYDKNNRINADPSHLGADKDAFKARRVYSQRLGGKEEREHFRNARTHAYKPRHTNGLVCGGDTKLGRPHFVRAYHFEGRLPARGNVWEAASVAGGGRRETRRERQKQLGRLGLREPGDNAAAAAAAARCVWAADAAPQKHLLPPAGSRPPSSQNTKWGPKSTAVSVHSQGGPPRPPRAVRGPAPGVDRR